MTLAGLVAKNALRNKRRTVPTILSIAHDHADALAQLLH